MFPVRLSILAGCSRFLFISSSSSCSLVNFSRFSPVSFHFNLCFLFSGQFLLIFHVFLPYRPLFPVFQISADFSRFPVIISAFVFCSPVNLAGVPVSFRFQRLFFVLLSISADFPRFPLIISLWFLFSGQFLQIFPVFLPISASFSCSSVNFSRFFQVSCHYFSLCFLFSCKFSRCPGFLSISATVFCSLVNFSRFSPFSSHYQPLVPVLRSIPADFPRFPANISLFFLFYCQFQQIFPGFLSLFQPLLSIWQVSRCPPISVTVS